MSRSCVSSYLPFGSGSAREFISGYDNYGGTAYSIFLQPNVHDALLGATTRDFPGRGGVITVATPMPFEPPMGIALQGKNIVVVNHENLHKVTGGGFFKKVGHFFSNLWNHGGKSVVTNVAGTALGTLLGDPALGQAGAQILSGLLPGGKGIDFGSGEKRKSESAPAHAKKKAKHKTM